MENVIAFFTLPSQVTPIVPILLAFIFGAAIGSFLNVLIWRLPREESIQGRSHCPHCNHQLQWMDLIPIFSIAMQRGRCRYCRKPVSLRYPLIEIITGALFALAIGYFPITDIYTTILFIKIAVVVAICITVFVIDLEHYLILDRVVFPGMILMLIFALALDLSSNGFTLQSFFSFDSYILTSLLGAVIAFIPFWLLWFGSKGKWMGYGDVKFVIFMGLALGLTGVTVALFASFMLGAIVGVLLIVLGKKQLSSRIPFGTFLSFATIIALFFGPQLWGLYWGLFTIS